MSKAFIVVEKVAYEGYVILRVYDNYKGAVEYADELALNNSCANVDYDVFERDMHTGGY
jgi:hypothetical protein